jgi:Protein of unknown function (DUF1186)
MIMSRRKRNPQRGTETGQIEWLGHRKGYPSAEERQKILQLRRKLSLELIGLAMARAEHDDSRFRALIDKYGKEEVLRAEQVFRESFDLPSLVADDARSNRDYRLRYSRFGAGLPFFTAQQRDDLMEKYAQQFGAETGDTDAHGLAEAQEVERLLLMDWRSWEDLTPLAVPPCPGDYDAPPPASYTAPIAEMLEWGNDLQKHHDFVDEREFVHWKKYSSALTRMALDPGLLHGWPAESTSWAPWHAIHMLGRLQDWESAPALAELADLEDDWLSDHLPHIWADMGPEAEPILWMLLDDRSASAKRRGLAAEGLYKLTEENEIVHNKVVKGFQKILQNETGFEPTLNGYLISFLRSMEALDEVRPSIMKAFDQGRVDPDIITAEDLEEDDDFEEDTEPD